MRRASQHSAKSRQNLSDFQKVQPQELESTTLNTKNVKKTKDFQNVTRCQSLQSPLREKEEEETVTRSASLAAQLFPVVVASSPSALAGFPLRKFNKICSKIVAQLETVKVFAETKTNESENLVDLRRQLQRADEFSIRFSRNNLYETKRIINEIKQLIVPCPFESLSPGHCKVLCKKRVLAFQAASQALQTYINYAKNPSNLEVPDKINELILLIADLFLCCEHFSFPPSEASVKHDAVKICNELMGLLRSKIPVSEYVEMKEADLAKNKAKKLPDDTMKMKKLSMYKTKLSSKLKLDVPKKKIAVPCLLGVRAKKSKKDDKTAKITHGIYTQKLNPWQGKGLGNKNVKFDAEAHEGTGKGQEIAERKPNCRRSRYITPREVRSQDDDVETMVQTIGDDEGSTCRLSSLSRESEDSELNKTNLKHFLLETIEGLQNADRKEQKVTLKKLLHSIQNCSNIQRRTPGSERVKVFHFFSKDLLEETENIGKEETEDKKTDEVVTPPEKQTTPAGERRLKQVFKPLKARNGDNTEGGVAPKGRIKLKLPEEEMSNAIKYRKAFAEYRRNNIMYKKTLANTPWDLVGKVSDRIILDIIKEISMDFENDTLLRRLYINELLEVVS